MSDDAAPTFEIAFDRAFARRAPDLTIRPQSTRDAGFLHALFAACSPLAELLPPPMLLQQAAFQEADLARRASHAMHRIVLLADRPIGRVIYDWSDSGSSMGVDIAVMPDDRWTRAGRHMLHAWLDVCDEHGLVARLVVKRDNPAADIYRRLGFVEEALDNAQHSHFSMSRPPRTA